MNERERRRRELIGVRRMMRRLWMRYAMRGVAQADNHERLDLAYMVPDPWHLDSDQERARFTATTDAMVRAFGRPSTILEVGCGEGVQSEYFARHCDRLTGIDVSARAIERARRRLPSAELLVGDLDAQPWAGDSDRFDVIVACEVIYYMRDAPKFLSAMSRLGRGCLVTYFTPAERRVGGMVRGIPGVAIDAIRHGDVEWVVATWRPSR
jgi:2-polyprenyl-3-methyl-5-hydroxy-6-metoxy-1,4-benzoquinol methylase